MWRVFSVVAWASAFAILQISFFSHLPAPFSSVSFPLVAIVVHLLRDRPLEAAGWALVAGTLLDLHGLFGFGTETGLLFAVFAFARFLHRRVLTNASQPAAFLLAALSTLAHHGLKLGIDGLRVIFGAVPYALVPSADVVIGPLLAAVTNGLAVVALLALGKALRARFQQTFFASSHAFRP